MKKLFHNRVSSSKISAHKKKLLVGIEYELNLSLFSFLLFRSAMVVQGKLLVGGEQDEQVRFMRKEQEGKFRLFGGSGPWEGRLEFHVNDTWMPMCLRYGRSFTTEAKTVCQQLNLYYYR